MPYFTSRQDQAQRICKVLADVFCAILLATFSIVFFGLLGGIAAFVVVEAGLLAIDWLLPNEDDAAGVVR
ncbi:hypothetical protein IVA87_20565 [Bradyrhizobium sp. 147]|uniref:hypothetical protein n=1 Tax=unclassified Bradyrhizobium TaxID=2631580 RepID=UPI001FFC21C6|nr:MULTISPECIES: hypothetical protein [unclassified Bradyrhizobium]MCK1622373.1 hypothetical protein [Bradyrhizobium sp. 160]MCK1681741.1 hypothetical protein [Bradyrhizobium sp. 147]